MKRLRLCNHSARSLWLERHGLLSPPVGPLDTLQVVEKLGFVQLDSIRHVERAHDHILWSRNQGYRPETLFNHLIKRDFFEHFTHDASLIPMSFLPMWTLQFARRAEKILNAGWWKAMPDAEARAAIKARISREGPLSTKAFESAGPRPKAMWQRPPHKLALDYMWYAGELATSHREKFVKFYDLSERVFPARYREQDLGREAQIDWLCQAALERLGFASAGEVQRFWGVCSAAEVRDWLSSARSRLVQIRVEMADKSEVLLWSLPEVLHRAAQLPLPSQRMRLLNPFDPAIRDRARCLRLFGFEYRNEIFVPEAQRKWGYYVYPLLEGTSFVGRVALKADRRTGVLHLQKLWPEPHVKWGTGRQNRLQAELARFARFSSLSLCKY